MPSTAANSFILDVLRKCALDEAKEQQQKFNANTSEPDSSELEVKFALNRAQQFVGNPDGTFPCPHCFIRGDNNILSHSISYMGVSELNCDVCNTQFRVGS